MRGKLRWISIGIFVICTSILIFSGFAEAALEKPTMHEGDYGNYNMTGGQGTGSYQRTMHSEIVGETTIMIEGASYDVWESEMRMEYTGENFTTIYEGTWYMRESDLATVKSIEYTNSTSLGGTSSSFSETIYQPIQPDTEYPLDVGDTWEIHRTNTVTDTTGTHTVPDDAYYECTGKEDVTTDAGTFSCYVVKRWGNISDTGNYTISYYSNEVGGFFVQMIMYTNTAPTTTIMLTSYEYTDKNGDGDVPGFEMVSLVGAIALAVIILRKRKYNL